MPSPISRMPGPESSRWYFDDVQSAFFAATEIRFGESYAIRYDGQQRAPATDFSARFAGRENLVALYAMATRQADLLSEYLCLYRVVESADGTNGLGFLTGAVGSVPAHDFGILRVLRSGSKRGWVNAFVVYRHRARRYLERLRRQGIVTDADVAVDLYRLRNSLAHGRTGPRVSDYGTSLAEIASALPLLKLAARMAVEP